MQNELTNEQKCMAQLFSVLCAIVDSDHTPRITIEATMQTLNQLFNNEDGPFMQDDIAGMTVSMIDTINGIVDRKNKKTHQKLGGDILDNINWN